MNPARTLAFLTAILLSLAVVAPAHAASRVEIDAKSAEALEAFYRHTSAGRELARKAHGVLIFPEVVKAGIGIGGEYGEGKLMSGDKTLGYYNIVSASIGFQLGAQLRSVVILFMTKEAYDAFLKTEGWKAGVDGSVAIASLGAGGEIDTNTVREPVIGFIFSNRGLMYNLTLEGSKISRINR